MTAILLALSAWYQYQGNQWTSVGGNLGNDVKVNLVSPSQLALPDEVKADLDGKLEFHEYSELSNDIVAESDVLYCTRVQGERFESMEEYERLKSCFVVDNKVLRSAKKGMIVMHPLPRNQEISDEVDFDQVIFFL